MWPPRSVPLLALACASALASEPVRAQATLNQDGQTQSISEIQAAELLVSAGRLDDAAKVLHDLQRAHPDDPEVLFLLGTIAEARKDYPGAVRLFRRILIRQPGAVRVRL